jgi:predicted house-cleaning NTP pyrophosphatase (Maf/HAM1 superfamily)
LRRTIWLWFLAEAKAVDVSERFPDAMVIGCDQTLSLGDEVLHKPKDMEDARRKLLKLSGKTHQFEQRCCRRQGRSGDMAHVSVARLTMRPLERRSLLDAIWRVSENPRCVALAHIRSKARAFSCSLQDRGRPFYDCRPAAAAAAGSCSALGAIDG